MTYLDAIILGLVQGVTEFIPVSSSGHLVIAGQLVGLKNVFTYSVLINIGTLTALIFYYRNRLKLIITRLNQNKEWQLIAKLAVATVPTALVGFLFASQIERLNNSIWLVVVMLIALAIPMILIGKQNVDSTDKELEKSVDWPRALVIGMAQVVALIPGTSRSGVTILAGLRQNLSAARSAEFSFLLAIPTIFGACLAVLITPGGQEFIKNNIGIFLVGYITSFIAGLLAVKFFIGILTKRGLRDFGWYRLGLAGILIILLLASII